MRSPAVWLAIATLLTTVVGVASRAGEQAVAPKMMGSLSCSSVACHGGRVEQPSQHRPREEFSRWLQFDPHARAGQTLASEKYQAILVRVSQREDRTVDPLIQAKCAKCHDPLSTTGDYASRSTVGHGIGCESCHGNAEKWLARHYERDVERSELLSLGMLDTKNLHVRGRQCASCHVGSAAQDMNHDMIAAGHPPLRFELAAYHELIPQKHWHDGPGRLEKRDYQVQLWAAGQAASAIARLELLAARCDPQAGNWPEFAEYNCFSCHRKGIAGLRADDELPGRPNWSRWNLTFVAALHSPGSPPTEAPPLKSLRELFRKDFAPDQVEVQKVSTDAKEVLMGRFDGAEITNEELLQHLASSLSNPKAGTDWETRCQQFLALAAAERSYRDELTKLQLVARLDSGEYNRRLLAQRAVLDDLALVRTWLRFEPGPANSALRDEPLQFDEHRAEIGLHLKKIAEQLRARVLELK